MKKKILTLGNPGETRTIQSAVVRIILIEETTVAVIQDSLVIRSLRQTPYPSACLSIYLSVSLCGCVGGGHPISSRYKINTQFTDDLMKGRGFPNIYTNNVLSLQFKVMFYQF